MRRGRDRETLQRFADTFPKDELEQYLSGAAWHRLCAIGHWRPRVHIHHIFHVGTRKDLWWNLVRTSEAAHAYVHKDPVGGMVACMFAVLCRAGKDQIADVRDEWRRCFGRDAIGWLQAKRDACELPRWCGDMAHAILEGF